MDGWPDGWYSDDTWTILFITSTTDLVRFISVASCPYRFAKDTQVYGHCLPTEKCDPGACTCHGVHRMHNRFYKIHVDFCVEIILHSITLVK